MKGPIWFSTRGDIRASKKSVLSDYLELNGLTIELNANLRLFMLGVGLFTQSVACMPLSQTSKVYTFKNIKILNKILIWIII